MESDSLAQNLFSAFEDEAKKTDEGFNSVPKKEPMKVYLRIRPFTPKEISVKEDQGCINIKDNATIEICAPRDSFTFKSSIRGLTDQTHQFSFSNVFKESTQQKEFFDQTMLPFVKDILDGQNGLVFTYGVTNSGKTYTIQGTPKDGGILPRALDVLFNSISKKLYARANLKPRHCHDIIRLSNDEEHKENLIRKAIFNADEKENIDLSVFKLLNSTTKTESSTLSSNNTLPDLSIIQKSSSVTHIDTADIAEEIRQRVIDDTTLDVDQQGNVKFGIWVSFFEIYNEIMYDLLDLTPIGKGKKRPTLKMGDDKVGNPYVKGLTEVFVTSSDEAYKVLKLGQRNRHIAATKLNQASSRSHCIFTIKLLKIVDVKDPHVARISRLSIVDLAGSERYCKTNAVGDLLKEASNINLSIMTLGKCISNLRYNQLHPNHATIIPFRESKLTRLFQSFFLGKGKASMIVNISQCASVFDETYNVMKFSAVAKQVKLKAARATELWKVPPLPKVAATPSVKRPPLCIVTPATASKKRTLENPTDFSYDELVNLVSELREKVKKERREKSNMEKTVREEVSREMNELIVEIESSHSAQLLEQKQSLEETMDKRLELLTKTVNKRRKRQKLDDDDDSYVSSVLYHAEKMKVKERDESILSLKAKLVELESESQFFKSAHTPEHQSDLIETMKHDIAEAKETLRMQNEDMLRMQHMLKNKDDEIDKLREALDDDENCNEQEKSVLELQRLLESTIKELEVARVKLDDRDKKIFELQKETKKQRVDNEELLKLSSQHEEWYELSKQKNVFITKEKNELESLYKEKESVISNLNAQVKLLTTQIKENSDQFKTVQFENDEMCIKLEKYERLFKEHQTALNENEQIIEELNKEVADLKERCKKSDGVETATATTTGDENTHKLKEELQISEQKLCEYQEKVVRLEKQLHCYDVAASLNSNKCAAAVRADNQQVSLVKHHVTPVKKLATPTKSPFSPAKNQQTVKKLEKLLEETTKALEKKTNLVVTKTNRIQQLEAKVASFEKKTGVNEIIAERDKYALKNEALNSQLDAAREANEKLRFEFENQEENLECNLNELKLWMEKSNSSEKKLESVEATLSKKQCEFDNVKEEYERKLQQSHSKVKNLTESNDKLNLAVSDVQGEKAMLEGSLKTSNDRLASVEEENEELRNKMENKTQEVKDLKEAITEKEIALRIIQEKHNEAVQKCEKLTGMLDEYKVSTASNSFEKYQKGYEEKLEKLHMQIDEHEEESGKLIAENLDLKEKYRELQLKVKDAEEIKEKLQKKFDSVLLELEDSKKNLKILQEKTFTLENDKMMFSKEKENFETKLDTIEKELNLKENELEESRKMRNEKEKEAEEMQRKNLKIQSVNEDQFKTVFRLEQEIQECRSIIATLKENDDQEDVKEELKRIQEEKLKDEIEKEKLRDLLESKEKDLKRVTEEKRVALDELWQQATKRNLKRPLRENNENVPSPDNSLKDDPDFCSPKTRKKTRASNAVSGRTKAATKNTINIVQEELTPLKGAISDTVESDVSMVCSVSIALSPMKELTYDSDGGSDEVFDLSVGEFVALKTDQLHSSPPIIGKLVGLNGKRLTVELWEGSFTGAWKVMKKKNEPVHVDIPRDQILTTEIYFTRTNRLQLNTKRNLQSLYM